MGKPFPMVDGVEKVTGRKVFGTDMSVPGMLHGKILRSPYAHARIIRVDASEAKRMPNVYAVITADDLPAKRVGGALRDEWVLARDKVRFIGEPVAAVAAGDEPTAEAALRAIRVEYEELPAVFSIEESLKPDAPLVHEELGSYEPSPYIFRFMRPTAGTNIATHIKIRKGDTEKALLEAEWAYEDTFYYPRAHHCYMEPHAVLAHATEDKVLLWTNGQGTFEVRAHVADFFDLPQQKIRVMNTGIGGGFGGKITPKLEPIAMALSRCSGRPVKITFTRQEEFAAIGGQHAARVKIKSAGRRDGTIVARVMEVTWDAGAAADRGVSVALLSGAVGASGPYQIPNLKVDSYLVYTNSVNPCAFRGMGMQQVCWAVESQMDIIAERLGMDAVAFRMKNAIEEHSRSATGEVLRSVNVKECLAKLAEAIEWDKQPQEPNRGKGIAIWHKFSAPASSSAAVAKMNGDGTVTVLTGASEIGQGSTTVLAQIAGEELGVRLEDVTVVSADTEVTPFDHGTYSSRVTHHAGNAVRLAAIDAREQLLNIAAELLAQHGAAADQLEIRDRRVCLKGKPGVSLPLAEVTLASQSRVGLPVIGRGGFRGAGRYQLDPETGQSDVPAASEWIYVAQGAEVEVDPETGKVKVLRLVGAYDCGKAINPLLVHGQIEGSLMMGLGSTLYEKVELDNGQVMNPSFMDYLIPTVLESPPMEVFVLEGKPHELGPYGAKGIGEAGIVAVAAAVGNALYRAAGVRIKELPLTGNRVLEALEEQRQFQLQQGGSREKFEGPRI
ncbi:MAG: molybdopterin-dependent oxidoreductase [Betaproteobacteria bacterium]|nr:molybdopterin-dependent oxidoreductase [Betaproteobacteria bacterium]